MTPSDTSTATTATKHNKNTPTRLEKKITRKIKYRDKMKCVCNASLIGLIVVLVLYLNITGVSAQTRDPRFYSRVGVNDYQWPNPGDPDYRYCIENKKTIA